MKILNNVGVVRATTINFSCTRDFEGNRCERPYKNENRDKLLAIQILVPIAFVIIASGGVFGYFYLKKKKRYVRLLFRF